MSLTRSSTLSMLGAVYAADLRELGEEGFQGWLVECFGERKPQLIGPYFIDDELDYQAFGDVFSKVVSELSDEEKEIAQKATRGALQSYKKENSTYEGLYNLARLAESLEIAEASDTLFSILNQALKDPTDGPSDYTEAYFLRETLEVLFRLVVISPRPPERRRETCAWAFRLATEAPYPTMLKFALAPLYVLGHLHARDAAVPPATKEAWKKRLDCSLLEGARKEDDKFPEFFEYEWRGATFPYDVGRLLTEFQNRLIVPQKVAAVIPLGNRYEANAPLENDQPISATSGTTGRNPPVSSSQVLEALEGEMV